MVPGTCCSYRRCCRERRSRLAVVTEASETLAIFACPVPDNVAAWAPHIALLRLAAVAVIAADRDKLAHGEDAQI